MLLRPNLNCEIRKVQGTDIRGKELLGCAKPAKCALVKLDAKSEKTTVRTDSSASQGYGREILADARLLFPEKTDIDIDDKVTVSGIKLTAISKFPRYSVGGKFDHWQVDLMVWA